MLLLAMELSHPIERTSCLQIFIVISKHVRDRVTISEIIKAKTKGIVI